MASASGSAAGAPPDIHAIFFDNDQKHIDELRVCPRIRCVKVPGRPGMPPNISLNIAAFASHIDGVPPFFVPVITGGTEKDSFDIGSGFREEDLAVLNHWIDEGRHLHSPRFAIFDFDRTISQIEGFTTPPSKSGLKGIDGFNAHLAAYGVPPMTAKMYMTYLCGSDRLELLEEAFDKCRFNNINIVILTNNGACVTDPLIMRDFMSVFGLGIGDFILICSSPYGGNKMTALNINLPICTTAGGGRKRTRKQRSQKKKTLRKKLRK